MISHKEAAAARDEAAVMIRTAGIALTPEEAAGIEVADFGLSDVRRHGAQIATLVQTGRVGVKVLALVPGQTLPEHWHPPAGDDPGKEETIRVAWGTLLIHLAGEDDSPAAALTPSGMQGPHAARRHIVMHPADQITMLPGTKHRFEAGAAGAVFFSFSTCARDAIDCFSDPRVVRTTVITD